MKNLCSLFLISSLLFICCNTSPYGKKITVNNHIEVYIKSGATEAEAKNLGNYIDSTWKTSGNKKSFQLSKDSGQYIIRMVVDENKIKKDSSLDVSFMAIQFLIEEQVFNGSKVKLILTDNSFKDIKTFESSHSTSNKDDKNKSDSANTK